MSNGSQTGSDLAKILASTGSGALTGAAIGAPIGGVTALPAAIIGGTIGLGSGISGALLSKAERKRQEEEDAKLKAELEAIQNRFAERLAAQAAAGAERRTFAKGETAQQAALAGLGPGQSMALQSKVAADLSRAEAAALPQLALSAAQEEAMLRGQIMREALGRQELAERQTGPDVMGDIGVMFGQAAQLAPYIGGAEGVTRPYTGPGGAKARITPEALTAEEGGVQQEGVQELLAMAREEPVEPMYEEQREALVEAVQRVGSEEFEEAQDASARRTLGLPPVVSYKEKGFGETEGIYEPYTRIKEKGGMAPKVTVDPAKVEQVSGTTPAEVIRSFERVFGNIPINSPEGLAVIESQDPWMQTQLREWL